MYFWTSVDVPAYVVKRMAHNHFAEALLLTKCEARELRGGVGCWWWPLAWIFRPLGGKPRRAQTLTPLLSSYDHLSSDTTPLKHKLCRKTKMGRQQKRRREIKLQVWNCISIISFGLFHVSSFGMSGCRRFRDAWKAGAGIGGGPTQSWLGRPGKSFPLQPFPLFWGHIRAEGQRGGGGGGGWGGRGGREARWVQAAGAAESHGEAGEVLHNMNIFLANLWLLAPASFAPTWDKNSLWTPSI